MIRGALILLALVALDAQAARYLCGAHTTVNAMREGVKEAAKTEVLNLETSADGLQMNDGKITWRFKTAFAGRDLEQRAVVLAYEAVPPVGTISSVVFAEGDRVLVRTVANAYGAAVTHFYCREAQ